MFEKAKDKVQEIKRDMQEKNLEREKRNIEKKLAEEKAREEQLLEEQKAIEVEKERLLNLDDRSLMVELIFAVRGFYSEFEGLKESHQWTLDKIDELESDISRLESELNSIQRTNSEG